MPIIKAALVLYNFMSLCFSNLPFKLVNIQTSHMSKKSYSKST
eukprot:14978.XXX_277350_277478_1 [CDS] Oithona nana genome sequencing.